jgi:hypothetical protein
LFSLAVCRSCYCAGAVAVRLAARHSLKLLSGFETLIIIAILVLYQQEYLIQVGWSVIFILKSFDE